MTTWLPYFIGFAFATAVAHFPIAWLVDQLWFSIGESRLTRGQHRPGWWMPKVVGLVERALYVGSLIAGAPQFIGFWLALKVAGQWYAWKDGIKEGDRVLSGHSIFSIFLIGNGVSIGYAFIGFFLISEIPKSMVASVVVPFVVLAATGCLWLIAKRYDKNSDAT